MKICVLLFLFTFTLIAHAQSAIRDQINADLSGILAGKLIPKPGEKMDYAGGILTRMPNLHISYYSNSYCHYSQEISSLKDFYSLAKNDPSIRVKWMNQYAFDIFGTNEEYFYNLNYNLFLFNNVQKPNVSFPLSNQPGGYGDYMVNMDSSGKATTVTFPDGNKSSVKFFLGSNFWQAITGANDPGFKNYQPEILSLSQNSSATSANSISGASNSSEPTLAEYKNQNNMFDKFIGEKQKEIVRLFNILNKDKNYLLTKNASEDNTKSATAIMSDLCFSNTPEKYNEDKEYAANCDELNSTIKGIDSTFDQILKLLIPKKETNKQGLCIGGQTGL